MIQKTIFLSLIWLLLVYPLYLFSQKTDSILSIYQGSYRQEKIHIHFDRALYTKGDTVWMKLYLMAGTEFSDLSKNVYIDWYTASGELLKHISAPLIQSSARIQFVIPVDYAGNALQAVAYTRWMLNFDSSFLYKKEIPIVQVNTDKKLPVTNISHIHFFPEGGDLVNGLLSYIAFSVTDHSGYPVKAKGVVKNDKGDFIDSLNTVHDGLGSFSIEPKKAETYTAYWTDEKGGSYTTPLPIAKESGINLEVHPLKGKTVFVVKRTGIVPDNQKLLHLIASMHQQLYYHFTLNLSAKNTAFSQFSTASLPTGVLTITVLDDHWLPLAERIVFVNNQQYSFHPSVSFPEKSLAKNGKNLIQIDLPDTVSANLSVSVTDAGNLTDTSHTIYSQLLLSSDIKGYVHNPAYYFSDTSETIAQHLDLLLLTHGWRRFPWEDMAQNKLPKLVYAPEKDYVQIKGQAPAELYEKMNPKPRLNVIISNKENAREILSVTLSKDASFSYPTGIFFDTVQIQYQFNGDKKTKAIGSLHFENGLLPDGLSMHYHSQSTFSSSINDSVWDSMVKSMQKEHDRIEKLKASATLQEVVVQSKVKSRLELLDEKYAKGAFSGGNAYTFDIVNDQIAQTSPNVLTYLQGRVPGLRFGKVAGAKPTDEGIADGTDGVLTWRGKQPSIFLNELKLETMAILKSPMQNIAYIKIFPPIFYGFGSEGSGGAVAIYLRDGAESQILPDKANDISMAKTYLSGYTAYKEFYSPDYSDRQQASHQDTRTTLYWNPYVLLDASHRSIQLPFFNNDHSKRLRVVIEGVNGNKQFTRVEKIIE